jgi:hypothetical protein
MADLVALHREDAHQRDLALRRSCAPRRRTAMTEELRSISIKADKIPGLNFLRSQGAIFKNVLFSTVALA